MEHSANSDHAHPDDDIPENCWLARLWASYNRLQMPTVRVSPADADRLPSLIDQAEPETTLLLQPGTYRVNLFIKKSIRIEGSDNGVILDGGNDRTTILVAARGA